MRNLSFVSLLFLLLLPGCISLKPSGVGPCRATDTTGIIGKSPFTGQYEKMLFRAAVDIRSQRLTGLILVKKVSDSVTHVFFSNEIGMTYFDFIMKDDGFVTEYCFEPMNKKALIGIFRTCFELMLKYDIREDGRKIYCDRSTGAMIVSGTSGRYKTWSGRGPETGSIFINGMTNFSDKTFIRFSNFTSGVPSSVIIKNPFIDLKMQLEMISF